VLSPAQGFFLNLSHMAIYVVLFIAGYTITRISNLLLTNSIERIIRPSIKASGIVMMGFGLWQGFDVFSAAWSPAGGIGLILLSSMLAVAVCCLGSYSENIRYTLLLDTLQWLKESPVAMFFIAGLIAADFIFIRPAIISLSPYAHLIEWAIICFIFWRIFSSLTGSLDKRHAAPVKETGWSKHVQQVDELFDEEFNKLTMLQEEYVYAGFRHDLMAYIKQMLMHNGLNDIEIGQAMLPIVEHTDRKVPWYAFWFWKNRILKENRQNRLKSLDETVLNTE
jgi:hypothetical protein